MEDPDVVISNVKNVSFQGISPEIIVVTENSVPSFLTEVLDTGTQDITIETFLPAGLFDSLNGQSGTISFDGAALLTYTGSRCLSSKKRSMAEVGNELAPFSLVLEVEPGDVPQIAQYNVGDGSLRRGVGMAAGVAGIINLMV